MSRRPGSALLLPVDAARDLVAPWRDLVPPATRGLAPHITLLWPFLEREALDAVVERDLSALCAGIAPFDFSLVRAASTADVTFLVPEPDSAFVGLTQLFWRQWPECPPHAGAYTDVAPYLGVAFDPLPDQRREIEGALAARVPLLARADAVVLAEEDDEGVWHERRRFRLGGAGLAAPLGGAGRAPAP